MRLPIPEAALKRHTAILGMTGSGKSSTGRLMVEEVVAQGHRVCILDTIKSDWWGITSSRSGKSPGLPFKILGGPRGHLPLHSSAGKAIGQLVGSGKLPLSIIDMEDFEPGGLQRFFVDFAQAFMRSMKGVVYLVIEEAHEVAPKERAGFGAENMAIHYAKKLGTGSRTKGIRLIVATQRVQALHNAVLGSCETVIAHRIGFADDQVPVLKWMKAKIGKENAAIVEAELANLPDGVGFLASGAPVKLFERLKFPLFSTYDNTATPEHDAAQLDIKTAPVDADELRTIIGDAVKEAEANDPVKLKAQIAALTSDKAKLERQAQVAAAAAAADNPQNIADAEKRGFKSGFDEASRQGAAAFNTLKEQVRSTVRSFAASFDGNAASEKIEFNLSSEYASQSVSPAAPPRAVLAQTRAPETLIAAARKSSPVASGDGTLPKGERLCLSAIAQNRNGVTRQQLTVITGYKRSTRDAYLQRLREKQYTIDDGGRLHPTNTGLEALGPFDLLPTGAALREHVLSTLPEGERAVLACVIEAYPQHVERDVISEVTGYKRSTRDAYIQRLSTRELVDAARGSVLASKDLFE